MKRLLLTVLVFGLLLLALLQLPGYAVLVMAIGTLEIHLGLLAWGLLLALWLVWFITRLLCRTRII